MLFIGCITEQHVLSYLLFSIMHILKLLLSFLFVCFLYLIQISFAWSIANTLDQSTDILSETKEINVNSPIMSLQNHSLYNLSPPVTTFIKNRIKCKFCSGNQSLLKIYLRYFCLPTYVWYHTLSYIHFHNGSNV